MKNLKRWLAGLMVFCMMLGVVPMNAIQAWAAEEPIVVVAGSDYQAGDPSTTLQTILKNIKKDYPSAYGALFCGDYSTSYSSDSDVKKVSNDVQAVYSGMSTANHVFVQGNHDSGVKIDGSTTLATTGVHDTNHYGVYVINYNDFGSGANGLGTYLDGKVKDGYKKPIFVLTHQPLHANSRGDNGNAKLIYDKLDAAGEKGLNIIFMFGHNHSGGYDAYLGNGSIYLKKGDSITVANGSSSVKDTLNFTYMNAGYIGYVNGSSDTTLTMTAFAISDDQVVVKRYDKNGQHTLKAAGAGSGGYTADTNVYGEAVINLANGNSTISAIGGGSGSGSGNVGTTGNKVDITATTSGATANVTISEGSTLTINLTNGSGNTSSVKEFKTTIENTNVASVISGGTLSLAGKASGTIVVEGLNAGTTKIVTSTDASSSSSGNVYTATINLTVTDGTTQPENPGQTPDDTEGTYKKVTSLEIGKQYLIVATSGSGKSYALTNNADYVNDVTKLKTQVTVTGDTVEVTGSDTDILWKVGTAEGSQTTGGGLSFTNNGTGLGRHTGDNVVELSETTNTKYYGHSLENGTLKNAGTYDYYLCYGTVTGTTSSFYFDDTATNNITFYEKVESEGGGSTGENPGQTSNAMVSIKATTSGAEDNATISVGGTLTINLTNGSGSSKNYTVTIEDQSVATLSTAETITISGNKNGEIVVKGVKAGTTTITASAASSNAGSYYTATINLTVTDGTTQPENPGQIPDDTEGTYKKVTSLEVGKQYLIVATSGSGKSYALTNNADYVNDVTKLKTQVTVTGDTVEVTGSDTDILWKVGTAEGSQTTGGGLSFTNNGTGLGRHTGDNVVELSETTNTKYYGHSLENGTLKNAGTYDYYLCYGTVTGTTSSFYFDDTATNNITFYEKVESEGGDTPHDHDYKAVVTAPTCTEAGYTTYTCACGESYVGNEVEALGHKWNDGVVTKEPTEDETGIRTFTCKECKETKTETIPTLDHEHKYTSAVTAPTCTEAGYTTYTCACGHSYTGNTVPAKGHTEKTVAGKPANCLESGLTDGKVCSVCEAVLVEQTVIPALDHSWDEGTVTKEPTEDETGIRTFTCTECKETKTETIPALEHDHDYKAVVTAPTCTEAGYTTYTCACGESYTANTVPAKGHTEVVVSGQPAGCMNAGLTDGKYCSVCDAVLAEQTVIPATGHIEVIDQAIPATCTEVGYTDGSHCGTCGTILKIQREVPALGHSWDEGVVTKEPTETEEGIRTLTCTECKETKTETIPVLGHVHSYSAVVTNPTCTEEGYTTYTCACGYTYTDNIVPALGHSYGAPVWDWSTDYSAATATFTCATCKVPEIVVAKVTVAETADKVVYTAVCEFNGTEYKEVKEVEVEKPEMSFTDVKAGDWYYEAVKYVYDNDIMNGLTETTFGPDVTLTRSMFATILYRLSGSPKVKFQNVFPDVKAGEWYSDAVIWAYENKVVTGYGNGTFGVDDKISRQDLVVMMYRYAKLMNYNLGEMADFSEFPDAENVSDYAVEAMKWAIGNQIVNGKTIDGEMLLDPQGQALRAECAAIIMRFAK